MILKKLRAAYDKQVGATGLAIFRITYSLVLLCEVVHLFYFRHLIYDDIPYIAPAQFDRTLLMQLWMVTILLVAAGCFAKIAKPLNYLFSLFFLTHLMYSSYEYHMFYAYMGINFLLMFLPVERCLSIDRLFRKLKYSTTTSEYQPPGTVSQFCYFIPLLYIGFVCFDSVFYKLQSPMWMQGLGLWLPASLPMGTHLNTSLFLNQEMLVRVSGFVTIFFEAIFIFLFWMKRFRWLFFLVGFALHFGILLVFPIPWFALGVVSIELLLIPNSFWRKLAPQQSTPVLTFYYDEACPLCLKTKLAIQHFDWFRRIDFRGIQSTTSATEPALADIPPESLLQDVVSVDHTGRLYRGVDTYIQVFNAMGYLKPLSWLMRLPGIYHVAKSVYSAIARKRSRNICTEDTCAIPRPIKPEPRFPLLPKTKVADAKFALAVSGIGLMILLQLIFIYDTSPLSYKLGRSFDDTRIGGAMKQMATSAWGLTRHPVFVDTHFDNYHHIVAVVYSDGGGNEQFLPIIRENGMPGPYLYGFNWVKWTFRVNSPTIKPQQLERGIRDLTAFWAHQNGLPLENLTFKIKVKKIGERRRWQYNYLNNQLQHPWINAGEASWQNGKFQFLVADIEKM